MVTITNGVKTFRVTSGAVKPYEGMGFHVVSDDELEEMNRAEQHYDDSPEVEEKDVGSGIVHDAGGEVEPDTNEEDAVFVEELLEKPLSQWSNEEIKDFVKIKGIDTSSAQKVSQVRGIIKAYLEEQQRNS